MATTTKTLTPTNQTVTLPDMTERPNASVLVDGISKEADAINALNSKVTNPEDPLFGRNDGGVSDANNLPVGWCYVSSAFANIPSAHAYFILTFLYSDHGAQVAIRRSSAGYMYFRRKNGGNWDSWYQVTANAVS